jgi:ankyrin repeat protein
MAANISKSHSAHNISESIFQEPSIEEEYGRYKEYLKFFPKEDKIFQAMRINNISMLKMLIDKGYGIDDISGEMTPLMAATAHKFDDMVELLIRNGADIDKTNHNGTTALMHAAMHNSYRSARILLSKGADPYLENKYGKTAFDYVPADDFSSHWKFMDKYRKVDESIFISLSDSQSKERKKQFFSKLDKSLDKSLYDLGEATRIGWYDRVVELLNQGADPKAYDSYALRNASMYGHVDIVKLLIPVFDPKADNSEALRWASYNGHVEVVKLLIPVSDPKADDSYALRWASKYGHIDIVKLLIPVSDPKAYDSEALRNASLNGHTDIVKILIPLSDPDVVKELGLIKENIFVPVSSSEYETRRNQAGAELVFAFINDKDMLIDTEAVRKNMKFKFMGSSPKFWFFEKRIPYKGHSELANMLMDKMNIEAGRKVVDHWKIRNNLQNNP